MRTSKFMFRTVDGALLNDYRGLCFNCNNVKNSKGIRYFMFEPEKMVIQICHDCLIDWLLYLKKSKKVVEASPDVPDTEVSDEQINKIAEKIRTEISKDETAIQADEILKETQNAGNEPVSQVLANTESQIPETPKEDGLDRIGDGADTISADTPVKQDNNQRGRFFGKKK